MATPVKTTAKANTPVKETIGSNTRAEIKRKAEAGIAMDTTTPEKAKLYAQDQARIKYLVAQRAKSGQALSESNAYKDGLMIEARKGLTQNDEAYFNNDNIMLRQDVQDDGRLQALEALLQKGADSSMQSQEALLGQARDKQILDIQKALEDAVSEGKISVREAEQQFEANKAEIDKQAYQDNERTELVSQDRGIQNSAQSIGLMQGDNARKNGLINENMTTRDRRVAEISDRIANITNKSKLDTANANANYGYGVANAQGTIDAQMAQNIFGLNMEDYKMDREQQYGLDMTGLAQKNAEKNMAIGQGYTQDNMAQQQGYTEKNMAIGQGYTQDNMALGQKYDLAKMSVQQKNQLEQMAKGFGYDMAKMSQAQINQLAIMAESFGYDMSMQNDGQEFQSGENALNRDHDEFMQNDSQSHQAYQDEQMRTHQKNMFGMEQSAKLSEYDVALEREMASYDANTPEGKLRIKQLASAKDALITETMTKTIGELMGQAFITKYGEGMTPEQMEKWLSDPTNLNNLNTKIKVDKKVPNEKKSWLTEMVKGVTIGGASIGAISRMWDEYKGIFGKSTP